MIDESVPADYPAMAVLEARRFDRMVRENFMPAIVSTARQVIEDATAYRSPKELEKIVRKAGVPDFRLIHDKSGLWAELKK
jgi:hypothetical protein